jgi:hypothetical protein
MQTGSRPALSHVTATSAEDAGYLHAGELGSHHVNRQRSAEVRIIVESEIQATTSAAAMIQVVEDSFAALARGEAQLPAVMHFDFPKAHGEAKSAW